MCREALIWAEPLPLWFHYLIVLNVLFVQASELMGAVLEGIKWRLVSISCSCSRMQKEKTNEYLVEIILGGKRSMWGVVSIAVGLCETPPCGPSSNSDHLEFGQVQEVPTAGLTPNPATSPSHCVPGAPLSTEVGVALCFHLDFLQCQLLSASDKMPTHERAPWGPAESVSTEGKSTSCASRAQAGTHSFQE